jgi:hypothetical protein
MGEVPLAHAVRAVALVKAEWADEGTRVGVEIEVAVSDFVSGTGQLAESEKEDAGIPLAARFTE